MIVSVGFFLVSQTAFCGLAGSVGFGALLAQSDRVVIATVRNSVAAGDTLSLDLAVIRSVKGAAKPGETLPATFSHPNVLDEPRTGLRMHGSISPNLLQGSSGLWFLQQAGTGWIVLPLMTGDIFTQGLYLPIPSEYLSSTFAYDASAAPKARLIREIGAAAQDPATAAAISRLEGMRIFVDLGPDFGPMLRQLSASTQLATRTMGIAGEIRLGTPDALTAVATSDLTTFPPDSQGQLANAVCDYRNTDATGIAALAVLFGPQYPNAMRTCAGHALREIHSRETLPALAAMLEDSSAPIRYDAVIGIAQFAMSFPSATVSGKPAVMASFNPPSNVTKEMSQHYPL